MQSLRIFRPAKNAMQSGRANTRHWVVEFEPADAKRPDPLMGWAGSGDTRSQVRLRFASEAEAVAFAERQGLAYTLIDPPARARPGPKVYADNFK